MLTGDLIRGRVQRGKLRLSAIDPADNDVQSLADRLIMLFGTVPGTRRDDVLTSINLAAEGPVNPIVGRGLAHLLWQRCELSPPPGPNAAKLRSEVFRAAARARASGIEPFPREKILADAGVSLGIDAATVERALFSDLPGEEIVLSFEPITSELLIRNYNLALVQGALLRSTRVVLTLGRPRPEAVRAILRAARFHRLLVAPRKPSPGRLELEVDGPANLLEETVKHGMQLACFAPWALCQPKFHFAADLLWGPDRSPCRLEISHQDELDCPQPSAIAGPSREVQAFAALAGKEEPDWVVNVDAEPIETDDGYWVPDLHLTRMSDQRTVCMDIITRGRPQTVAAHLKRLAKHAQVLWLVAANRILLTEGVPEAEDRILPFRAMPLPSEVFALATSLLDKSSRP